MGIGDLKNLHNKMVAKRIFDDGELGHADGRTGYT
jgi:hypothetical protein